MDRLPLWGSVACVGLLVFVAPGAWAGNNNNNKPAPSHPAAAAPHPAVQQPHPGGGPAGRGPMGGNPMMGGNRGGLPGNNMAGRGPTPGGNRPFGGPGGNGMAGAHPPFGGPGGNGMAGGQHPFGGNPGAGGAHPFNGGPGGNGMAGGPHGGPNFAGGPHGGPGGNGMAGGPHGGPNVAGGPGGGRPGEFGHAGGPLVHPVGGPGPMPHGGMGPGGMGPGHPGFGNPAGHGFAGAGHPGFAGHYAPAARITPVAGAHIMSHHDLVEHRAATARDFGPGHNAARDREFVHAHEHDFHTRDVRGFDEHERARWAGGRWHEDWHYGRYGYFYQVDDVWYPYDAPVYPYPTTVAEIVVPDTVFVDTRPELVAAVGGGDMVSVAAPLAVETVSPTGEEMVVRPLPAAPVVTYNCTTLSNVYPTVRLCPITWAIVAQ